MSGTLAGNAETANEQALPTTPEMLYERLAALGISYELHEHQPVFTVAESAHLTAQIPGVHTRNLFVRDKKGVMFLIVAAHETPVDLKKLQGLLGCGRLSFGSADRLWQYLGVRPGSVCPFAIINDTGGAVTIMLDKDMMAAQRVNYHPLENDKTVGLAPDDLVKFIESTGHQAHILDLSPAAPDE